MIIYSVEFSEMWEDSYIYSYHTDKAIAERQCELLNEYNTSGGRYHVGECLVDEPVAFPDPGMTCYEVTLNKEGVVKCEKAKHLLPIDTTQHNNNSYFEEEIFEQVTFRLAYWAFSEEGAIIKALEQASSVNWPSTAEYYDNVWPDKATKPVYEV